MIFKNNITDFYRTVLIFLISYFSFTNLLNFGINQQNFNKFFLNLSADIIRFTNIELINFDFIVFFYKLFFSILICIFFISSYWYLNPVFYNESNYEIFFKILLFFSLFNISFFYLTRLYDLSRIILILYLAITSFLFFSIRSNSTINNFVLNRPDSLNYVIIKNKSKKTSKEVSSISQSKYLNRITLINYQFDTFSDEILHIEKRENIDFYIVDKVHDFREFDLKKILNLNKDVIFNEVSEKNYIELKPLIKEVFLNEFKFSFISSNLQNGIQFILKRIIDIVLSSILLVLTLPLIVFLCLFIFFKDFKNPIVTIERTGKHSRLFKMFKIRTMKYNSHELRDNLGSLNIRKGPLFKIENDPRLLKHTKWIRKYSLDELPQFVNVIRGDMSLVGPRPLFKEDLEKYKIEDFIRLSVLPGITGLLQIKNRETEDFELWKKYDNQYITRWSLFLDLKIILLTPLKIFLNKSI